MTFENFIFLKAESIELIKLIDIYNEWTSIYKSTEKEDLEMPKKAMSKETKKKPKPVKK